MPLTIISNNLHLRISKNTLIINRLRKKPESQVTRKNRIKVSKFDKKAETLKRSMSLFALPVGREMSQIYKIVSTIQSMCQWISFSIVRSQLISRQCLWTCWRRHRISNAVRNRVAERLESSRKDRADVPLPRQDKRDAATPKFVTYW